MMYFYLHKPVAVPTFVKKLELLVYAKLLIRELAAFIVNIFRTCFHSEEKFARISDVMGCWDDVNVNALLSEIIIECDVLFIKGRNHSNKEWVIVKLFSLSIIASN